MPKQLEDITVRIGWKATCKLACRAMIAGCTLDEMIEHAMKLHLQTLKATQ